MIITHRDKAAGGGSAAAAASRSTDAQATHARVRHCLLWVTQRVRAGLRALRSWAGTTTAGDPASGPPRAMGEVTATAPPPLADLAAYTRAGDWVPGEQHRLLEAAGKAYGYLIAIPISAALYVVALLIQRPTRAGLAVLVLTVVWLTT